MASVCLQGVRIYAVQCGTNSLATKFWQTLALKSHGKHLHLESFSHVIDLILAICSREYSLQKLKVLVSFNHSVNLMTCHMCLFHDASPTGL